MQKNFNAVTMQENRIEKGIRDWREREQWLKNLFGEAFAGHRDMEKAKLDHYREVAMLAGLSKDEQTIRKILVGEIRNMERKLYPSRLVRAIRTIGRVARAKKDVSVPAMPAKTFVPLTIAPQPVAAVRPQQASSPRSHEPLLEKKRVRRHNGIKR